MTLFRGARVPSFLPFGEPEPDPEPSTPAEAMAEVMSSLAPLREAVTGYRVSMLDMGFSDEAATAMAVQLHFVLLHQVFGSSAG